MEIDFARVQHAAQNGIPLVIKTQTVPPETDQLLTGLLRTFLEELGQLEFFDLLVYCLRELIDNAKVANLKKAQPGPLGDDLWIRVTFLIQNQVLYLSVRNNLTATAEDQEIVRTVVDRAWAAENVGDSVGHGLATLVLILKKLGLDQRSFDFVSETDATTATLKIPMSRVQFDSMTQITAEIASAVESIPPFPPNLTNLFRLLEDPEVEFRLLANELAQDPAMTADLIKYINSASNRGYKKIDNLEEAIRLVGTRGLKDLMYPYGAHRILGTYLDKQRQLWENAVRVARYAVELAAAYRFDWNEKGQTQIVGLLYNLGQIVLTFLYPQQGLKILEFCREKRLSVEAFDRLTQSINPAALGALIAEKWNFPHDLVVILKNQNCPVEAPEPLQRATAAVGLASSLRLIELDLLHYSQISPAVLKPLGLDAIEVPELHQRLRESSPQAVEQFAFH